MTDKKLVVVSGVTGSLGEAYLKHYRKSENKVVGISRNQPETPFLDVQYLQSDLIDEQATNRSIRRIPLEDIADILLIHPVGKFKFEDDFTEIDQEVYASNVQTFTNLADALLECTNQAKPNITLVAFGSISDKYDVPFWKSYSESKNALRRYIHKLTDKEDNIRGVFFNLSSVKTRNESNLRPFANTGYWLTPEEIVRRSVPELSSVENWKEVDIYNLSPDYSPEIYTDYSKVLERWTREMYGESN